MSPSGISPAQAIVYTLLQWFEMWKWLVHLPDWTAWSYAPPPPSPSPAPAPSFHRPTVLRTHARFRTVSIAVVLPFKQLSTRLARIHYSKDTPSKTSSTPVSSPARSVGVCATSGSPTAQRPSSKLLRIAHHFKPSARNVELLHGILVANITMLKEAAAAFPPLQGAAGALLVLLDTYKMIASNDDECRYVLGRASSVLECLRLVNFAEVDSTVYAALDKFVTTIKPIAEEALEIQAEMSKESTSKRFFMARNRQARFQKLVQKLDDARNDFQLSLLLLLATRHCRSRSHQIAPYRLAILQAVLRLIIRALIPWRRAQAAPASIGFPANSPSTEGRTIYRK